MWASVVKALLSVYMTDQEVVYAILWKMAKVSWYAMVYTRAYGLDIAEVAAVPAGVMLGLVVGYILFVRPMIKKRS